MTKKHNQSCKDCKKSIYNLLCMIYGEDKVEVNYDINLPSNIQDLKHTNVFNDLDKIYQALQQHRGHFDFVKVKKLPRVDFCIPDEKLIIEFDESQHFTKPREIALGLYPQNIPLGFSVKKWRDLCGSLDKHDKDPIYRDEQRAWYDTLRDFAPLVWGEGKTIRLYASDLVWCSLDPKNPSDLDQFTKILLNH